jgi:dCMP deaminase
MIINAGITKVIYEGDYPDDFSLELFRQGGIALYRFRENVIEEVNLVASLE